MNVELVPPQNLKEAEALISKGKCTVAEGVAVLLIAKAEYSSNAESIGGVNCSDKLNTGLKILRDDPYLAIGMESGITATDSEIKKAYRKFALKYHPDKTQNRTGLLFTVIQTAYTTLSDTEKRKSHDARVKKNQIKLEKMRGAKEASEKRKAEKEKSEVGVKDSGNLKPPPVSTNSFRQPPQSKDEASYRAFNKKFFNEFRKKNRPPTDCPINTASPPSTAAPPPHSSSQPPKRRHCAKVRLKATHRSDSTVTLSWSLSGAVDGDSTAYELQWRVHGQGSDHNWDTSAQLILGHSCRKKNLNPGTCYAFRVRAATAGGWSPYCEPVMVVTNNNHSQQRPASASSSRPSENSTKQKKAPPKDTFKQNFSSVDAWHCAVCKRPNGPDSKQCIICYTKRSYVGKERDGKEKGGPNTARPSTAGNARSDRGYFSEGFNRKADESDEEYGESAWDFDADTDFDSNMDRRRFELGDLIITDGLSTVEYNGLKGEVKSALIDGRHQVELKLKDSKELKNLRLRPDHLLLKKRRLPRNAEKQSHRRASQPGSSKQADRQEAFNGARSNTGVLGGCEYRCGFPKIYYLDKQHTKLHNVRSEPILESRAVGSLVAEKQVLALAEVGDWLKVEWHVKNEHTKLSDEDTEGGVFDKNGEEICSDTDGGGGGWLDDEFAGGSGHHHQNGEEEVIYELRDSSGDLYYFNGSTGISCWDPPEWIDSIDPLSGACYYENTITGSTQWETPFDFIPVIREEAYSTPEAEFIKSVLSPKRSRGPDKFYSPDEA